MPDQATPPESTSHAATSPGGGETPADPTPDAPSNPAIGTRDASASDATADTPSTPPAAGPDVASPPAASDDASAAPAPAPQSGPTPSPQPDPGKGKFFWGTGRRKAAVARVRIRLGTGKLLIRDREIDDYFFGLRHRLDVVAPLKATDTFGKYDVFVNVHGGGQMGQARAILLGIARALREADPALEDTLRDGRFLTRDARKVERKKPGQPGARKRFQFSKR